MRCASIERFWKPAWRIPRSHSTNAVSCTAPPCGRWKPSRCAAAGFSTTAAARRTLDSGSQPRAPMLTPPTFPICLLSRATMRALETEPLRGRRILDYGCGPADFGLWLATEGADVTLLDLSPVAIELAVKGAHASVVAVRGIAA